MLRRLGGLAGIGILCAIAAPVAVWSGPLEAVSGGLHTSTATVQASTHAHQVTGHESR